MKYTHNLLKLAKDNFFESILANIDKCSDFKKDDLFIRSLSLKYLMDLCLDELESFSAAFFDEVFDDE